MSRLEQLLQLVEKSRGEFILALTVSPYQAEFNPSPDSWSIRDIAEHMVWAERIGVMGMWKALESSKKGIALWEGENPNAGLSIEEVIQHTWKEREQVPEVAAPKWGGPLPFWIASLKACSDPLSALGKELAGHDLAAIFTRTPFQASKCRPTLTISTIPFG